MHTNNILTLYVHLYTVLQHVSVVPFNVHHVQTNVCDIKTFLPNDGEMERPKNVVGK